MSLALSGATVAGRDAPRLADVTVAFDPAVATLVVGPNGAGKSTLLRALAGLDRLATGRRSLDGADLAEVPRRARAAAVAWLPQHPRPEEGLTSLDVVAAARFRFREPQRVAREHALAALAALGAEVWAERPMTTLSGGEAQRVRLAALTAQDAAWWLLDEPFNHLDPGVRLELLGVVRARAAAGGGLLLVSHDLTLVPWLPGARVLALVDGRIAHDGPADDPDLPAVLGPLLGVRLQPIEADGARRFVITGPA